MPRPADRNELIFLLARAFDQAWDRYYQPTRRVTIPEDVARSSLATHLIKLAEQGIRDEIALAEGGIQQLISLTPEPWGHVRIDSACAKSVSVWRVRLLF
jgi:hypothetical protein